MEDTIKNINIKLDYLIDLLESHLFDLERDKELAIKWQAIEENIEVKPRAFEF